VIVIFIVVALITVIALKDIKIDKLKNKLEIKETENLNLKKVMASEGLIPKKFVK
jgi:predicted Holliday junction resolvase-like endonuclease